jgi:hypothetical protein
VGAKPQQAESAWASLILPCLDHKQVGSDDPTVATPDSGQYPPVVRAREVIELRPPPRPGVGLEQQPSTRDIIGGAVFEHGIYVGVEDDQDRLRK